MKISAKNKLCVIVGDPVEHSLSPKMHNAAYEALNIDDQFVFVAAHAKVEDMEHVVKAVRVMNIRGLTCTIPHKMEVMKYIDEIDPLAKKIGAVNTVVNDNGVLKGYNTDCQGTIIPLEKVTTLKDKKVALIGAGGAARAIAYGVTDKGAILTIYNRTVEKAEELAKELNSHSPTHQVSAKSLDALEEVKTADIVLNATSLGMAPDEDKTPCPIEYINENQVVFDAVYTPYKTKFLRDAEAKGAKIIPGIEMLLHQGTAQFTHYTNHPAPEEVMRKSLLEHFGLSAN